MNENILGKCFRFRPSYLPLSALKYEKLLYTN